MYSSPIQIDICGVSILANRNPSDWVGVPQFFLISSIRASIACDISSSFVVRVLKKTVDLLSIVHELQQFPDITPRPKRDGILLDIRNIFWRPSKEDGVKIAP